MRKTDEVRKYFGTGKKQEKRKKTKYNWIGRISLFLLLTGALVWIFRLWNLTPSVPVNYGDADNANALMQAKWICSTGWGGITDRLAAPYGSSFLEFPAHFLHMADVAELKLLGMLTGNAGMALNLQFFLNFYLTAFISYWVMRQIKLSRFSAVTGSLVFALFPYAFMKGCSFPALMAYYFVPLSVLLCVWIYQGEDFFCLNRTFFKNKKNILALIFIFLISANGLGYYPFFTGCMLLCAALSALLKRRDKRALFAGLLLLGELLFFTLLFLLPGLIHGMGSGYPALPGDTGALPGDTDVLAASEILGLKLIQLFMPLNGHGIPLIEKVLRLYSNNTMYLNENVSAYLGIIGIVGFIILILTLLAAAKSKSTDSRIRLFSEMNLVLIFTAQTGGLGTLLVLLFGTGLTAYNRGSIFIGYLCILTVGIWVDRLRKKWRTQWIVPAFSVLALLSIVNQVPQGYGVNYTENYIQYHMDRNFVKELEEQLPQEAMIFQLPGGLYEEDNDTSSLQSGNWAVGYFHSDSLRWSAGAGAESEAAAWIASVQAMEPEKMAEYLKACGFAGIFIDCRAYDQKTFYMLTNALEKATGHSFIYNENAVYGFIGL